MKVLRIRMDGWEPRKRFVMLRLTTAEKEMIAQAATRENFSNVSEWIRKTLLDRMQKKIK